MTFGEVMETAELQDDTGQAPCCKHMKISLVICSRDRASRLSTSLLTLLKLQSNTPWELIIVDNGSTDETQEVIESFRPRFSQKLVSVIEPAAGLSKARNTGWSAASGEIIAFTDDDCYPATDFLVSLNQCFGEDDQLGFVGGRILLYDETDYRISIQERSTRRQIGPNAFIPAGLIQGANLACRRSALVSVEGFDDRFGHGAKFSCEDVDMLARLSARGWHGAYDPRLLVYHHHGHKTREEAEALMKQYDRARGAYYAKCILNPGLRKRYLRAWLKSIRRQPAIKTWRELTAAVEFLVS